MSKQKMDGTTYITGVEKNDEEIKKYYSSKDSPSINDKKNSKTIEHSNNKIISIVFPIVKQKYKHKNNYQNLFKNYPKIIKNEVNKNGHINKSYKNISVAISQIRNRQKKLNHNYFNNNSLENESKNESINNRANNGSFIISNSKDKDKHESNNKIISNSINMKNKDYNDNIMNKRFKNLFRNGSSLDSKFLKEKLFGKEKPELSKEENKQKFRPSLIEKYNKRLFYNKSLNNYDVNIELNDNKMDENNSYKVSIKTFHNKNISYVDKIDKKNVDLSLPPIVRGSKYNSKNKSIETININSKKNVEENDNLEKNRNVHKLTKKEILNMIKGRKFIKFNQKIVRATRNINKTSDKIRNIFNRLRISLNEYDDWNDPKNIDNLYDD